MTIAEGARPRFRPLQVGRRTPLDPAAMSSGLLVACWVAIAVGLVAAVRFYARRGSLWEDELIAITHANQPLPSFFMEMLRNDIHPPLYFLQLDAWLAIGANNDRWALANSLLWAAISLATIYLVARALHGRRAAWLAAALFAVLPSFVWSAGTLRMYAAIPACAVFVYYANRRWFETRTGAWLLATFFAEVLLAYVHAVEFYFVAFIVFGALVEALTDRRMRMQSVRFAQSGRMWMIVQVLVGLCVLPLAASALLRGSDAAAPDSASAMLTVGGALVAGWKTSGIGWVRGVGTVVFVVLAGCGVWARDSRVRTLVIPLGALLTAVLVSLYFKPIFKQPVFAANLLPFLVLGAVAAAAHLRPARALVVACLAILAVGAIPLVPLLAQGTPYAAAARSVRDRARPGDIVVVPNVSVYWGILRYAVGPAWGRPLSVFPPPNDQWSRLNQRIARTLGPDAPQRLGLVPERDYVDSGGVRYILGENVAGETADAPHVWLVTRERYQAQVKLDPRFTPSEVVGPETFGDGELLVRRFDRGAVVNLVAAGVKGWSNVLSTARGPRLSILIFHRVLAHRDPLMPGEPDAAAFEARMTWLAAGFRVLPLVEAVRRLRDGSLPANAACVTFDDGYADNATIAAPILARLRLTATFFIASGFLDGGRMWNDTVIESVRIASGPLLDLDALGCGAWPIASDAERLSAIDGLLERLKYLPQTDRQAKVDAIADAVGLPARSDLMMTRQQVRELRRYGMSVGAHTVTHPILTRIGLDAARREIADGRLDLEETLNERVKLFAYPNGKPVRDYDATHVALVRELGFDAAVSTAWGVSERRSDPFQLARFTPWDADVNRFGLRLGQNMLRRAETAAMP